MKRHDILVSRYCTIVFETSFRQRKIRRHEGYRLPLALYYPSIPAGRRRAPATEIVMQRHRPRPPKIRQIMIGNTGPAVTSGARRRVLLAVGHKAARSAEELPMASQIVVIIRGHDGIVKDVARESFNELHA